jgi:hypothetical protein
VLQHFFLCSFDTSHSLFSPSPLGFCSQQSPCGCSFRKRFVSRLGTWRSICFLCGNCVTWGILLLSTVSSRRA